MLVLVSSSFFHLMNNKSDIRKAQKNPTKFEYLVQKKLAKLRDTAAFDVIALVWGL